MKKILKKIWQIWKSFAQAFGRFNAHLILTLFYFLIIGPIAIIRRGIKLLSSKNNKDSYWLLKREGEESGHKNQF